MNKRKVRSTLFALAAATVATFGVSACSTGTDPGEANVDRGEIHEEGSMVGREEGEDYTQVEHDSLEQEHYDHADHENHKDNTDKVIGDGAYDGEGDGHERDDVEQ